MKSRNRASQCVGKRKKQRQDLPAQVPPERLPVFPSSHPSASHPAPPAGQSGSSSREWKAKQGSHDSGTPNAPAGGASPDNHGAGTFSSRSDQSDPADPTDPNSNRKRYPAMDHLGGNLSRDPRAVRAPRVRSFLEFLEHHARVPTSDLRHAGEFERYTFDGREALREPCRVLDQILGSTPELPIADCQLPVADSGLHNPRVSPSPPSYLFTAQG